MTNKITKLTPKERLDKIHDSTESKTHEGFINGNPWQDILDIINEFYDPLADDKWTKKRLKTVDHAYIQSLLAVDTVLKRQRKEINKKIKAIKTALAYIKENK